jgi:hypothetical protein
MGKSKRHQAAKTNGQQRPPPSTSQNNTSNSSSSFQPLNMFFGPRASGYSTIPSNVNRSNRSNRDYTHI